jgi:NAD(P)-dependent dehydrogenase (short-subunit alcohol dehydrogenase family)
VVTGANKGVGYEIVRQLAEQGLTVVLTARDSSRGQAALDTLKKDGLETVWFHELDVQSSESVKALGTWVKSKFGGIDILVSTTDLHLHF